MPTTCRSRTGSEELNDEDNEHYVAELELDWLLARLLYKLDEFHPLDFTGMIYRINIAKVPCVHA